MAFDLQGRLSLRLYFDGLEFPFDRVNSVDFIHMSSSTRIGVPMLHMRVIDSVEFFSNSKLLADGTLITIAVQPNDSARNQIFNFRLNSYKKPLVGQGSGYEFDGYLDAPIYWIGSRSQPIDGSSSLALTSIAEDAGLTFVGDATTDTMSWWPRNKPNYEFARYISEYGYRTDHSCMQLGVSLKSELRYVDLSKDRSVVSKFIFPDPKQDYIHVVDFQPSASSGVMNAQSTYSEKRYAQSALTDESTLFDKLQLRKLTPESKTLISADLKKAGSQSRVRFSPIDVGNVHPYYEQAIYQNRRLSSAFSQRVSILTPEMTNLGVLDYVSLTLDFEYPASPRIFNGSYYVSAHTIYIQGNNYMEKFELCTNGVRNNSEKSAG